MAALHIKKVEVRFISRTFFQFSSVSRIVKLSKVIPALFIRTSKPPSVSPADSIKDSIFFPMITGKQKGTGLGLSITQGIISQHKGNVHYNTRSNRTEFFINLPITNSQEQIQEIING